MSYYRKTDNAKAQIVEHSQAEIVANGISTTIASTKQFTEYLNDIYAFSYAKGVLLEIPQDLAWCRG